MPQSAARVPSGSCCALQRMYPLQPVTISAHAVLRAGVHGGSAGAASTLRGAVPPHGMRIANVEKGQSRITPDLMRDSASHPGGRME